MKEKYRCLGLLEYEATEISILCMWIVKAMRLGVSTSNSSLHIDWLGSTHKEVEGRELAFWPSISKIKILHQPHCWIWYYFDICEIFVVLFEHNIGIKKTSNSNCSWFLLLEY